MLIGTFGCTGFQGVISKPDYWQADQQLAAGNFDAAIQQYREISRLYPRAADEGLFKIGCIQAHPRNPNKDYGKALESFRQLVAEHPRSAWRSPTDAFIAILGDLANREKELAAKEKDLTNRDRGAPALKRQVDALERQVDALQKQIEQMKEIDRSREEKRREMPPRK
jgi:TolA-binding protein